MVRIDALRRAIARALDHVEAQEGPTVELKHAVFWDIPPDARHDPYTVPTPEQLTLGDLDDAWTELQALGAGADQPLGWHLVLVASVLRELGEQTTG